MNLPLTLRCAALGAISMMFSVCAVEAQPQPLGEAVVAVTTIEGDQSHPAVVSLDDGFFFLWHSRQPGDHDVFGRVSGLDGNWLGDDFRINTNTPGNQRFPSGAVLENGNLVVVWSGKYRIRAQQFDLSSGVPEKLGREFVLEDLGDRRAFDTTVRALPDGGFLLVWRSAGEWDVQETYELGARRFDAEGRPDGAIYSSPYSAIEKPAVGVMPGGDVWLATDGALLNLDEAGAVLDERTQPYLVPALAVNRRGNLVLAGSNVIDLGVPRNLVSTRYAQVLKSSGAPIRIRQEIQASAEIVSRPAGGNNAAPWRNGFVVVWHSDESEDGILVQTVAPRGKLEHQFEAAAGRRVYLPAVGTSGNTIAVAWTQEIIDLPTRADSDIFVRFYRSDAP